jgi:DNA adenine methylase
MAQYQGGKNGSGTYQQIINLIPPHSLYFEGFAGSAAIYFNKCRSRTSILCDISCGAIDELKLRLTMASIAENCDTRAATIAAKRVTAAADIAIKNDAGHGSIAIKYDTLRNLEFLNHFLTFCHSSGRSVFAYFDPPYPFEVRKCKNPMYDHELTTADHIAFLSVIRSSSFPCMISTYRSSMYDEYLKDWNSYDFYSTTRKGKALETVYYNYPKPSLLHDFNHLGNNFREREAYNRIRKNMIRKLETLPESLRNAILKDITSHFNI